MVFTFYEPKPENKALVKTETEDTLWHYAPKWAKLQASEETSRVTAYESKGIGFYYIHVLVDDRLKVKTHARSRLFGQTIFSALYGTIKKLWRRSR